ncbi:MAG: aminotransferase class I/II-fold pyridoxal phosphate-dependent enzyme [Alphaproteobacteria bacterium]|nr:aminotransferase class I/II-fold pyridoxal phosphate-dependent enzyme [Alphaproteobacteria bacterium]
MQFPERFSNLPEYAFPRLRALLADHQPGGPEIAMSIGEPKHPMPDFVGEVIAAHLEGFGKYPPNDGSAELLAAISGWIKRRYGIDKDPLHEIIALSGTREGLFNAAIALCPEKKNGKRPKILIPNPFYQVYAVASLAVAADPVFISCPAAGGFLPDLDGISMATLEQTAIFYLCSPSNPQGAIASRIYWKKLIALAEKYDFQIFADECYSEIYRDTPPPGILEIAQETNADPERVLAFHSLSKRSNLPGLRSGFAAGGAKSIAELKRLRAYSGAPLPLPLQAVAAHAWSDEAHVNLSRDIYREKYQMADEVFGDVQGYLSPEAGFFLWLPVDDGEVAAVKLWRETGVKVLPGAYLAREVDGVNPGAAYIRVAMVAEKQDMQRGLLAIRDCIY